VLVSFSACIRYYGLLSSRRFAEDELFILASFDDLSVQKMYTQIALRYQRNPAMFEPFSEITEDALRQALDEKELRRQGPTASTHDQCSISAAFVKTVEISGSAMWSSDGERAQCRRRAFAYQARFGQPAFFVTLTPNVADTFVMAQYCGITSVDTLFDAPLAEPLGQSTLLSASLRNNVASARLFMRNVTAFVEHALGVPPKLMKSKPFEGRFGDVKAYFGMVETQGGCTLHIHFLVWLADAPPNTDAFNRAVAAHGDRYYRDVEDFANSIESTSMPVRVEDSSCFFCGHSYADPQELPIPPEAGEDPNKQQRARGEPALVRCSGCGAELSSQHVIRRLLLDHRLSSLPPPMQSFSSTELASAVRIETPCRAQRCSCKTAVYRRDLHLFVTHTDTEDDASGKYLHDLNRATHRFEHREDDSFRDNAVARALAKLPPSRDDDRWLLRAVMFAVSVLVFLVNHHWWSHVGSCFKSSRASARGQCRYGFPRARQEQTCCSSDGVTRARRAPFEYVNGFNREVLLASQSNHDIHFMICGCNALLRIYYATKYVTKMQEEVDSITAVALAAFKRRQLRKARNADANIELEAKWRPDVRTTPRSTNAAEAEPIEARPPFSQILPSKPLGIRSSNLVRTVFGGVRISSVIERPPLLQPCCDIEQLTATYSNNVQRSATLHSRDIQHTSSTQNTCWPPNAQAAAAGSNEDCASGEEQADGRQTISAANAQAAAATSEERGEAASMRNKNKNKWYRRSCVIVGRYAMTTDVIPTRCCARRARSAPMGGSRDTYTTLQCTRCRRAASTAIRSRNKNKVGGDACVD
jgi:hypothetical protein